MTSQKSANYFYSHGKLLLTGEYLVMKGAKAIALPLNLGQSLTITEQNIHQIEWETYELDKLVFTARFHLENFDIQVTTDSDKARYLQTLFNAAKSINPQFLNHPNGLKIEAKIQFNMSWGFGTSSTLINNLAQWAQLDAFELNRMISKGSGFDIACAQAKQPILYQLANQKPLWEPIAFKPSYLSQLFLVHLNKKMPTEQNISGFNPDQGFTNHLIPIANDISHKILYCSEFNMFQRLITEHEKLIGTYLQQKPVKEELFADFQGAIKSLGAWGGDFVLTASSLSFEKQKQYFKQKGFSTVLRLEELMIEN